MTEIFLSKQKLEEFKKELSDLKTRGRREISERLRHAKEMGDLSENADYTAARDEQRLLEKRIGELTTMICEAVVIEKNQKSNEVKIGSTIKAKKDDKTFSFVIVSPEESQPSKGLISDKSPLGKSFLKKKVGETAEVNAPSGLMKYKILRIE